MTIKYIAIAVLALPLMLLAQSAGAVERALPRAAAFIGAKGDSMSIADLCGLGGVLSGMEQARPNGEPGAGGRGRTDGDAPRTLQERWSTLVYKPGEQVVTVYNALGEDGLPGHRLIMRRFGTGAPPRPDAASMPGGMVSSRVGGLGWLTT